MKPDFQEDDLDIAKILNQVLENWWFFVMSVVLCLGLSYAYVWYTHPVYEMSTTVLVEDEGNDISQSILDEVGVLGKKRNIENEIAILKSRSLMEKAISSLGMQTNYVIDLGLRSRILYHDSPFVLEFEPADSEKQTFSIHLKVVDANNADITLVYVSENGSEMELPAKIQFGETFENELGRFSIQKSDFFEGMASGDSARSQEYELVHQTVDEISSFYLSKLQVTEARKKASILRLTLEDNVKERGVDVLNALLRVYIQENIKKKNQLASNSLKFIENQISVIADDLTTIEADIKSFKSSSGISDVSSEATFFLEQVGVLDKSVSEVDVKLSIINYLKEYVSSEKDLKNASPSSLGVDDPLLSRLIGRLSELTTERESMLRFTKEENPLISSIDTKIEETRASLVKNIESIKQGLLASRAEFQTQLKKVEGKVNTLPKAEYELLGLQRQYSIKESLYLLLLEKRSENSIVLASTVSDNMIIDEARSSKLPIKPQKNMVYLLGLLLGFGIPSVYVMLLLTFDNRIKNLDDLKKATPIPVLGTIPHHNENKQLVLEGNSNSAIAEAFRSVRTNLAFVVRKEDQQSEKSGSIVQLTSTMGSEGKSFCSINLASSLALGGLKTIVVGLDLRKPKLAEYFNIPNKVGASSVLANIVQLNDAIVKSGVDNLDVLVGGPIPPNPSELLMSKALSDMVAELGKAYDYVILDCPPIGLVTDSLIVSEHADTTIYMTRQNVSYSSGLSYINDLYRSKKIGSVSILFNDVKTSRFGYDYGYGYGYSYGYYAEPTAKQGILQRLIQKLNG